MHLSNLAQKTYGITNAVHKTPKSLEFEAFARITYLLKRSSSFSETAKAVHENRRLWTLLSVNVADPENELPSSLRAQIFYLAEFTNLHSQKVLSGDETSDILIEINTAVMRGLEEKGNTP